MKITNNIDGNSHAELLKHYASLSEHILLVSPFIFDDFTEWIGSLDIRNLKSIDLVTSLKPFGDDQIRKPKSLLSFIDSIGSKQPAAKVTVNFDNALHGKIYIFKAAIGPIAAITTSANLTASGLSRNHEWGILIKDAEMITEIEDQVRRSIEYDDVTRGVIANKLALAADNAKVRKVENIDAGLLSILKHQAVKMGETRKLSLEKAKKVFLKPIGEKESPVLVRDRESFSSTKTLSFPKPRPQDVFPNDIIICFGTGSRAVLTISTALTMVEEIPKSRQLPGSDEERWPWWLNSINHTPKFSGRWWESNITIDALLKDYKQANPESLITLGTFNFGAGRLEIDKSFAAFIIQRIMGIEESLAGQKLT